MLLTLGDCLRSSVTFIGAGPSVISLVLLFVLGFYVLSVTAWLYELSPDLKYKDAGLTEQCVVG